ncbi:NUDIX domain-containing protein [Streptomyces sp. A30]|uniref:NUDIX domain-containing protein n=1 Tax=Streptomyces sp. A30 TaxID=2789273 RepID=UPI00397F9D45
MTTNDTATTAAQAPAPVSGPGVQVVAALLRRGDHIVLVQEQRDGLEMWSIPGGGVERGELLTEALVREVREETGLNLTAVGPLAYLVNTTTERYPSTVVATFDCAEWDGEIAVHDPDGKVTGAVLLPLDEAKSILVSSTATRPEIEPLLDYLDSLSAGRVWSYRDAQPIE